MNLRIADGARLVAFLHGVVSRSGRPVLTSGRYEVVEVDGQVFYHGAAPLTVGGPFESVDALIRSEGRRRTARSPDVEEAQGESAAEEAGLEGYEWAGSYFSLGGDGGGAVLQYASRIEAQRG